MNRRSATVDNLWFTAYLATLLAGIWFDNVWLKTLATIMAVLVIAILAVTRAIERS